MTEFVKLRRRPGVHEVTPGRFVVTLPWHAPPLRENDRRHRFETASITSAVRAASRALANRAPRVRTQCQIRLVWFVNDQRKRDSGAANPTLKAAIDGLVDAGVLVDDHCGIVLRSWCEIKRGVGVGVDLILEEVTE